MSSGSNVPAAIEGPFAKALELSGALEEQGVRYALGGALAYGIWAIPRATLDVDINVFVDEHALAPVTLALASLGIAVDEPQMVRDASENGFFVVRYGGYRVDVFTASIPFCAEAERTRVLITVPSHARSVWVLSAESIAVFKMMFYRPKDIVDLERLLAVRGTALDVAYVRTQLVDMVGSDDERIGTWDRLVTSERGRTPEE